MRPMLTAKEMRSVDERTMKALNCSSFDLMDNVATAMAKKFAVLPKLQGSVLVLCGPGNNGGDGYRLAEKLKAAGRRVWVKPLLSPVSKDCEKAAVFCTADKVSGKIPKVDILVDSVFGTGGRGNLPEAVAKEFRDLKNSRAFRVSLDIPSGIDSETGELSPDVFEADLTLCVGYLKLIFAQERVAEKIGQVEMVGDFFVETGPTNWMAIEPSDFKFQKLKRSIHKGERGRCGVIGGSPETPGAAILAAEASHRAGSGYSTLFFAKPGALKLRLRDASFLLKTKWDAKDLSRQDALVVGCGGIPKSGMKYDKISAPLVIDADALAEFAKKKPPKIKSPALLTPHPGEAAKILGISTKEIQSDRRAALDALVKKTGRSVYLKGAPGILKFAPADIIAAKASSSSAYSSSSYYVNLSVQSVLGKAGSGDILSGLIGGFLAQRPDDFPGSVISALVFQSMIAEVLQDKRGTIASDQLEVFSEAFRRLAEFA